MREGPLGLRLPMRPPYVVMQVEDGMSGSGVGIVSGDELLGVGGMPTAQMPFDQLSVRIDGRGGIFVIHDVEFYSRPISSWLPNPDKGVELIAVGSDLRRGVGLSNFRGVRGEFTAPENDGFLSFSLGVPRNLRYPSGTTLT